MGKGNDPKASAGNPTQLQQSRRRFLKQAVATGVVLSTGSFLSSKKAVAKNRRPLQPSISPAPGLPLPWQASQSVYGGLVNLLTGNVMLRHSICSWRGKGGGLSFVLFFNSQSTRTDLQLSDKWSHSFSHRLLLGVNIIHVAGDGTETLFTPASNGNFTAPNGIYDKLIQNSDGSYSLTKKGQSFQYRFNAQGVLDVVTDINNNQTICTYNNGLLSVITDAVGRTIQLAYNNGYLSSATDFEGRIWSFSYTNGRLTQVSDPAFDGQAFGTQFSYVGSNISSVTNRLNKTWEFSFGQKDDLTQMTDADGAVWSYQTAITALSQDQEAVSQQQQTSPVIFWPQDVVNVGNTNDPTGAYIANGFDEKGRLVAVRGATDNRAIYAYDNANNCVSKQTDNGAAWNWTYDAQGNMIANTDSHNHTTTLTYDVAGRLLSSTDAMGQSFSYGYNNQGNRVSVTDTAGNLTTATYDAAGLVTQTKDARNKITTYQYNTFGNVTQISDPLGHITSYQYVGSTDRLSSRVDARNRTTQYNYDTWGRLSGIIYPANSAANVSYVLDAENRLISSTDGTGTRTSSYNVWGKKIGMTDPMGNTQATYDAAGRLLTQTDVDGRTHTYLLDSLKRVAQVSDGTQSVQYDYNAISQVEVALFPNGTKAEYSYDSTNLVTSISHRYISDDALIVSYDVSYDYVGRPIEITEQPSGATTNYEYDAAGRLIHEERFGNRPYLGEYTYDENGNRLTSFRSENGVVSQNSTYTYNDASQITTTSDTVSGLSGSYDWYADGTLRSYPSLDDTLFFTYDEEKRVTRVERDVVTGQQTLQEYGYAADGGKRWVKNYETGLWTWYPCGVACCAGALVEKQSDLLGTAWNTSAVYLRGHSLVSRNANVFHFDPTGAAGIITDSDSAIITNDLFDVLSVQRYSSSQPDNLYVFQLSEKDSRLAIPLLDKVLPLQIAVPIAEPIFPVPGYQWCGAQISPGKGDINPLDACCHTHDDCFKRYGCNAINQIWMPQCQNCTNDLCNCARGLNCSPFDIGCTTVKLYACPRLIVVPGLPVPIPNPANPRNPYNDSATR